LACCWRLVVTNGQHASKQLHSSLVDMCLWCALVARRRVGPAASSARLPLAVLGGEVIRERCSSLSASEVSASVRPAGWSGACVRLLGAGPRRPAASGRSAVSHHRTCAGPRAVHAAFRAFVSLLAGGPSRHDSSAVPSSLIQAANQACANLLLPAPFLHPPRRDPRR